MHTLEEVVRFCEPATRRNYHKISLTEKLPTAPGVYLMKDAKGAPLYIGKAENLRRRTRDHFLQRQAFHARQALELLERIDVIETGSEFAALLLESRLIAKHRPPYNSHGTKVGATTTSSSARRSTRACTPRPTSATTGPTTPGRSASPAWPGASSTASTAPTRCAPARTCRAAAAGTPASAPAPAPASRPAAGLSTASTRRWSPTCAACSRATPSDLDRRLVERQQALVKQLAFEQAARLQNQRETLGAGGARRAAPARRAARRPRAGLPARRRGWVALWGVRAGGIVVEREVGRGAFGEQAAAEHARRARRGRAARARRCRRPRSTRCCWCTRGWTRTAPRPASSTCAPSSPAARTSPSAAARLLPPSGSPPPASRPARPRRTTPRWPAARPPAETTRGAAGRSRAPPPPRSLSQVTPPSPSGAAGARSARWR